MGGLLGLLVAIILLCLVAYLIFYALSRIPLPEPVRVVVTVLIALIFLVFIVRQFNLLAF